MSRPASVSMGERVIPWMDHARVSKAGQDSSVKVGLARTQVHMGLIVPSSVPVIPTIPNYVILGQALVSANQVTQATIAIVHVQFTPLAGIVVRFAHVKTKLIAIPPMVNARAHLDTKAPNATRSVQMVFTGRTANTSVCARIEPGVILPLEGVIVPLDGRESFVTRPVQPGFLDPNASNNVSAKMELLVTT